MAKLGSRWMSEKDVARIKVDRSISKYKSQRVEIDNIKFSSKKEGKRYQELKALQYNGDVSFFLMQVPFKLPGNTKYVLDFLVFWKGGIQTFEDVKGMRLPIYKLKKRQVEALYPIKIEEV